jgi:hypothetical protein
MQVDILIDIVGANNIDVVKGGDNARLTMKPFQRRSVIGFGGGQDFDRHTPPHELVFTEVNTAHASRADAFQDLIFTNSEAAPFALKELFGLEMGQDAVTHKKAGKL